MTPSMSICVCGWYFEKFDPWYASLHRVKEQFPVFVVCNRDSDFTKVFDLPFTIRENNGLEFGAYNHFLMHHWPDKGGVLFCHDDIVLNPVVVNGEVLPPEWIFKKIAQTTVDQAYIFGSRAEDVENYGQHGRMIYCSEKFLTQAKKMGGFWYDERNHGYTSGQDSKLKETFDCMGYNAAIISFNAQAQTIGGDVHRKIFIPAFDLAKRGQPTQSQLTYGKWMDKIHNIASKAEIRLNIGSGNNPIDGNINIDLYVENADVKAKATSLPYEENYVDFIQSHHLIEHLEKTEAFNALTEWHRVLKPNSYVFLSCPDLIACTQAYLTSADTEEVWAAMMKVIYGDEDQGMSHRYGYCKQSMKRLLEKAGFREIEVMTAYGFRPTPSLLALGRK
jgi:predicted SAM-dependent methyltransferase